MSRRPLIVGKIACSVRRNDLWFHTITWSRHSRRMEPTSRSAYGFCQGDRGAVSTPPFPYLGSWRRSLFRRLHLDRGADISVPGPRETLLASAAWSTPGWGVRSPRSAPHGVDHGRARGRQTEPGRSPSVRGNSRVLRSG